MKLIIKDNNVPLEDVVTLELRRELDSVRLVVKKNQNSEQVILTFFANGTIKKTQTYTDIGFKTSSSGHIEIV